MNAKWILLFLPIQCAIASAQSFEVDTLQYNGSTNHLINLVILGDGYQANELPQFALDAEAFQEALFQETPYNAYREYFNVFLIKTPSNVSGAAMHPDTLIDNYYGSTYWYAGIERLLAPVHTGKVVSVLSANFPNYDQVFLLVNHTKYGGSGGWVATASLHDLSSEIAIHEIGHSFASLKDEYWAGDGFAGERANMTKQTNPQLVKWKNWYGENGIGIFQHCCGGTSALWYRPHENCKMRSLNNPFCSVCCEQTVESIHLKVGTPIVGFSPDNTPPVLPTAFPLKFELDLLKPNPNTLNLNWLLNGENLDQKSDSLLVDATDLNPGLNSLSVFIEDTSQVLRVNNHSNIHFYTVAWTINYSPSGVPQISATSGIFDLEIYPNPASEYLQFKLSSDVTANFNVALFDVLGNQLQTHSVSKNAQHTLNLSTCAPGIYSLTVYANQIPLASRMLVKL